MEADGRNKCQSAVKSGIEGSVERFGGRRRKLALQEGKSLRSRRWEAQLLALNRVGGWSVGGRAAIGGQEPDRVNSG